LITGESGTGKELVAQALHRNSPRSGRGLYNVNCAAFTETLLGSELFGHERGAFTGANSLRKGLFETADGGTVFLDEIGECSMAMQGDLLRVLQSGTFKRQGGNLEIKVNVRIIAATNVDLEKAIREGRFRQDLYFRLNVIEIRVPRLAERREDIRLLAAYFIKKYGYIRSGPYPPVQGITPEAYRILESYDWPGNVREFENVVQKAITLGSSSYIGPDDLPKHLKGRTEPDEFDYVKKMRAFKKVLYERALRIAKGDRAEAARLIHVHPNHFSLVCKELGISRHGD
jgi:DNA-binding NtrC family response regulator